MESYWKFNNDFGDFDNPRFELGLEYEKLWQDTYTKMLAAEDDVAKSAVIAYLRNEGYIVIAPEDS